VDLSKPFFILEMDVFDFALGVALSQFKENDIFHLVDFCFCKVFLIR
jgi:hypothetical protein